MQSPRPAADAEPDEPPAGGTARPSWSAAIGRRGFIGLAGLAGALGAGATAIRLHSHPHPASAQTPAGYLRVGSAADRAADRGSFLPLRPPATPLAVRSMYLSAWLQASSLPGNWPTFWTGRTLAMTGLAVVDGTTYTWCGAPAENYPLAIQKALVVTATKSTYTLTAGPVTITASFFSPVDPASLRRQCVPMSYLTVSAAAHDGGRHQVRIYLDISAEWAHGDDTAQVRWAHREVGGLKVMTVTPAHPAPLTEFSDQASWGTVVWATDAAPGLSWQAGRDTVVRRNAARGALPDTSDTRQPRAISDQWPVFGFLRDLGTVTAAASTEMVACIGHVREPAVSYLGAPLRPLWTSHWRTWPDMLRWFRADLPAARRICAATDAAVRHWADQRLGPGTPAARQYAGITALALRQAFSGTELVRGPGGSPWAFLKEISSDGNVSTLDVIFPASPAYLQLSPRYLELLLAPVFDYAERHHYPHRWAPHDLGAHYPRASGHLGRGREEDMPIEESANILMLACAVMSRMPPAAARAYASAHYPVLRRWAVYLLSQEPDYRGTQNQTDDFTGRIAASVNLNLKGIIGLGAFSQIAGHAGRQADRTAFAAAARRCAGRWARLGKDRTAAHLDLAYGDAGTYSLKYNAFADRLLDTNLVSPAIRAREAAWYQAAARRFGVPLDGRHTYTKGDWEMLTAAFLYDRPAARNLLIADVFRFLDQSPSRVPFADWYGTLGGVALRFRNRPVVGGAFALDALRYPPNGLTGYWSFGSGLPLDRSGNRNDLALAGGAAVADGLSGSALAITGPSAHASSARPVVRTDGSFTVMARVRLADAREPGTAVSQRGISESAFRLHYSATRGTWAFTMSRGDAADAPDGEEGRAAAAVAGPAAAPGRWVHLAGVHDAERSRILLYVDGVPAGSAPHAEPWHASGGLQVGRALRAGQPAEHFRGDIDEVATYSRALSAAEVAAAAARPDGLLASYAFDEGSGRSATDQAGDHDLTLAGAVWGTGFSGTGLAFSRRNAAATAPGFLDTSASFTVSAWVLLADVGDWRTIVSQDGATASGFRLEYSRADDAWALAMPAADARAPRTARAAAPLPPRVGDWQHLAGVHDAPAGQLRLYVDGRLAAAVAGGPAWRATGLFAVGRALDGGRPAGWFSGGVDQLRVWRRALADADISVLV